MTIDNQTRKQMILDAAAQRIIQYGYDKTTMGDIAGAVGLNRALLYAHFKSKDEILVVLIAREMRQYGQRWIEHLLEDPEGGTVASIYRSIGHALRQTPFMAAIVTRDEGTWGKYLRKPGNIFSGMQTTGMMRELMQAMQDAGAIRKDVNVPAMAYIADVVANGMVSQGKEAQKGEAPPQGARPPFEVLLETVAEMFDRMLTPEDGGNREAGKNVLRQMAEAARAHFDQMDGVEERQQQ